MNIFFYDHTFEGLLTAVFDAYSRKSFPDQLLHNGDITPLFTTASHTVVTDSQHASRVATALEKKIGKYAFNMLVYTWLSEIKDSDQLMFQVIRKIFDRKLNVLTDFGDQDIVDIHKIARKVSHEALYLKQFVRFQLTTDDIYFAIVKPVHNALPLTINHFTDRFKIQQWAIFDINRNYGFFYDLHHAKEFTLEQHPLVNGLLPNYTLAEEELMMQNLWKNYFQSINIKERVNPKLQRQHMPKRFWKYITEVN